MMREEKRGIDVNFEAHDYRSGPWVAVVSSFVGIWTLGSTSLWFLALENLRLWWPLIPVAWFLGLLTGVAIVVSFSNVFTRLLRQELKDAYGRSSVIFAVLLSLLAYLHLKQPSSLHQMLGWIWMVGLVIGVIGNQVVRRAHFKKYPPCPVELQGTSR